MITEDKPMTAAETTALSAPTAPRQLQSYRTGDGPSDSALHVEGRIYERRATPRNPGPNPDAKHPWERAGLGVAPYRCVGSGTAVYRATPDAPAQPGASCDFCGQGIMNVFCVQGACKSVFKVGCDCVYKVCDRSEGVRSQVEAADKKHRNALAKASRDRRDAANKAALVELRAANLERLTAMPHPRAVDWPAMADRTALDWLDFMLLRCGATGRAALLKELRSLLA